MNSRRLIVLLEHGKIGNRCKPVGIFVARSRVPWGIRSIFGEVHYRASHSISRAGWKEAESKLLKKYSPNLFNMVSRGIKKEIL